MVARKIRTEDGKSRKLSMVRAIEGLEEHGVEMPDGHAQPSKGLLVPTTVNRWLRTFGFDHGRLTRAPPAVRFEASTSNEPRQFDMSPSDLKKIPQPGWIEPGKGAPMLILFSFVDGRSGATYQEYLCVCTARMPNRHCDFSSMP